MFKKTPPSITETSKAHVIGKLWERLHFWNKRKEEAIERVEEAKKTFAIAEKALKEAESDVIRCSKYRDELFTAIGAVEETLK